MQDLGSQKVHTAALQEEPL